MKRVTIIFLRIAVVLFGMSVLAFLLWEPHVEGRNAHATLFEIYFNDPFLAFAYVGSISFFVAAYQAYKVLGYVGQDTIRSQPAVNGLRIIKNCAMIMMGFVGVGELFIILSDSDDRAGGVAIGVVIILGSIVVFVATAMFQRRWHHAVALKSQST